MRALLLVVSLPLVLAACSSEPIDPSPQGVYRARCARCHEIDGSSATASEQADKPIDLRNPRFQRETSDQEIRHIVIYGEGRMQGIEGITDEQVDSVIVYVRSLSTPAPSTSPTPEPEPGP